MAKQKFPDLKTWLESIGLSRYAHVLEREEITLDVLGYLTETDLERIGLPLGPRKKILHELVLLDPTTPPAPGEGISEEVRRKFEEARDRADERARREAEDERGREAEARAAAEERARLEAYEKAKTEARAELAKREAELRKREAESVARAEAEARARRELEEKIAKDAEARAKAEAGERARREAEESARQEAEAKTRIEVQARAKKGIEERAKHEAEFARRKAAVARLEAELTKKLAESPKAKLPAVPIVLVIVVAVAIAFGANNWKNSRDEARVVELTAAMDAAIKASQDLSLARQREEELLKRVEVARLAEQEARTKGDEAKLKELREQTRKAEAASLKQAELVRQREVEARKANEAARTAEARKQADSANAAAEKAMQARIALEKAAREQAAQAKGAAAPRPADKAVVEAPAVQEDKSEDPDLAKANPDWNQIIGSAASPASRGAVAVNEVDGSWEGSVQITGFNCPGTGASAITVKDGRVNGTIVWNKGASSGTARVTGRVSEGRAVDVAYDPRSGPFKISGSIGMRLVNGRLTGRGQTPDCVLDISLSRR